MTCPVYALSAAPSPKLIGCKMVLNPESTFQSPTNTLTVILCWLESMWAVITSWAPMLKKIDAACVEGTAAPARQQRDSSTSLYPEEVKHVWLQPVFRASRFTFLLEVFYCNFQASLIHSLWNERQRWRVLVCWPHATNLKLLKMTVKKTNSSSFWLSLYSFYLVCTVFI